MIECLFNFFKEYCKINEYLEKYMLNQFITSPGPPIYPIKVTKMSLKKY